MSGPLSPQVTKPGGFRDIVEEYRAAGRIKWFGFSTHAMTPVIVQACESGVFDYVNLHYQYIGCHTATGSGAYSAGRKRLGGELKGFT